MSVYTAPSGLKEQPDKLPDVEYVKVHLAVKRDLPLGRTDLISNTEAIALLPKAQRSIPVGSLVKVRDEPGFILIGYAENPLSGFDQPWVGSANGTHCFDVLDIELDERLSQAEAGQFWEAVCHAPREAILQQVAQHLSPDQSQKLKLLLKKTESNLALVLYLLRTLNGNQMRQLIAQFPSL